MLAALVSGCHTHKQTKPAPHRVAPPSAGPAGFPTPPWPPGCFQPPQAVFLRRLLSGEQVGGLPTSGDFPGVLQGKPVGEQSLGTEERLLPFPPENKVMHVASTTKLLH